MGYIPPRPVGESAEAVFHQAVWDAIFGGDFPFIDQPHCLWNRTSQGYYPTIKPPKGGKPGTDGMVFRGEWDDATGDYVTQNVVIFTPDGGQAGAYVAVQDVPVNTPPDTGAPYWVAWPYPPPGVWGA